MSQRIVVYLVLLYSGQSRRADRGRFYLSAVTRQSDTVKCRNFGPYDCFREPNRSLFGQYLPATLLIWPPKS